MDVDRGDVCHWSKAEVRRVRDDIEKLEGAEATLQTSEHDAKLV
jgi:hypothetical protein